MQITIYIDDSLVRELDRRARKGRMSRSRYVQELLRQGLERKRPENLLSAFGKIPDLKPKIRSHLGRDARRKRLT
ncbi:ribbon-helix-helix protein, CopG family [Acidobacteria bacterium AH-259-O06]|nr:ribbon-helix-helix protein, CopG family [Acidobacteria bacterium AH-259-O06]